MTLIGFVRYSDGRCKVLESVQAAAQAWQAEAASIWIDLEHPDESTLTSFGDVFKLSGEALEDCLHGEQRPRIDEYDDHIFLMLYGVPSDIADGAYEPKKLALFCGSRFLISVHQEGLRTIDDIRSRCGRHAEQWLGRGVDFLMYSIIDGMTDRYGMMAEALETRLDQLEDRSLAPRIDEGFLTDLSQLRRELLALRHIAASQRDLLVPIAKGECDYIGQALEIQFSHVRDHLTQVVEHIERLRELLNAARDDYHSAIADRMANTIKTLTVFASVLLPLSLVAGVYGMNLPVWPPSGETWSFWAVLGAMAVIGTGLLAYFRSRRWI